MSETQQVVLGIGSGRCGTLSLAELLNNQVNAQVTHEQRPLLPWDADSTQRLAGERVRRFRESTQAFVGDVASFYLPSVEAFIELVPNIRIVCLRRDRETVVNSFAKWSNTAHSAPADHWSLEPQAGLFHDPVWSTIFPKYDVASREAGIGKYWDAGANGDRSSLRGAAANWTCPRFRPQTKLQEDDQ